MTKVKCANYLKRNEFIKNQEAFLKAAALYFGIIDIKKRNSATAAFLKDSSPSTLHFEVYRDG